MSAGQQGNGGSPGASRSRPRAVAPARSPPPSGEALKSSSGGAGPSARCSGGATLGEGTEAGSGRAIDRGRPADAATAGGRPAHWSNCSSRVTGSTARRSVAWGSRVLKESGMRNRRWHRQGGQATGGGVGRCTSPADEATTPSAPDRHRPGSSSRRELRACLHTGRWMGHRPRHRHGCRQGGVGGSSPRPVDGANQSAMRRSGTRSWEAEPDGRARISPLQDQKPPDRPTP